MMKAKEIFLNYCFALVGKPYIWGGNNAATGVDCSGFAQSILSAFGVDPIGDQRAMDLYAHFVDKSVNPTMGALVFYGRDVDHISHVAVCISEHQIVEAGGAGSNSKNVAEASELTDAMVRIRPLAHRKDIITIVMPEYPRWCNF